MGRPAVFLDRDGVINENIPSYVRTWDQAHIFPYVSECLHQLKEAGFPVFVVTNQSIVGRGIMSLVEIENLHQRIIEACDPYHAILESYICPHEPNENCECRKPKPGSLLKAAMKYDIDLAQSYMVGDAVSDTEAGLAAGTNAILIRTGRGAQQELLPRQNEVIVMDSLVDAVQHILIK